MSAARRPALPQTRQEWRRQVTRADDPQARHLATALLRARAEGAYSQKTWNLVLFGLAKDAIVHRKPTALQCLLIAGAPLESPRKNQDGLLLLAAHYGERGMVSVLLAAGASALSASPQSGRTVLHVAAAHGDVEWLERLAVCGCSWKPDHEGVFPLDVLKEEYRRLAQAIPVASLRRLESLELGAGLDEASTPRRTPRRRL